MPEFIPLQDYDYTYLGLLPEDWIEEYLEDVEEMEDDTEDEDEELFWEVLDYEG